MIGLSVTAFGIAWWLGLYVLARDARKGVLRRAGLGLLAYAMALVVGQLGTSWLLKIGLVLTCLPALAWSGVFVLLGDEVGGLDWWWRFGVVPLFALVAAAVVVGVPSAELVLTWIAALGLSGGLVLLLRRWPLGRRPRSDWLGPLLIGSLMAALVAWLVLLAFGVLPRGLLLAGMAPDLVLLGWAIAAFDAFDEGEVLGPDMGRSALVAGGVAVLFGGQVGTAIAVNGQSPALVLLLFGTVAVAILVQVLATPIQAVADRVAFRSIGLRRARGELREIADALPRKDSAAQLASLDEAEFARLTRRALSHYSDLGKLVSNPLVDLPVVDERLARHGVRDAPLERATELKAVLSECITRLKPQTGEEFGTSEEWHYYNALYFYYVRGVRPYSVRTKQTSLDPICRRALSWFVDHVPERTLHNWQNVAARIVAGDLRTGIGETVT
jgi:hypothetical protein